MSFTDKATPKDLVKVIEACAKAGVAKFKLGEVEIEFTPQFGSYPTALAPTYEWNTSDNSVAPASEGTPTPVHYEDPDLHILDPVAWDKAASGGMA